jgi:hypothetical protein
MSLALRNGRHHPYVDENRETLPDDGVEVGGASVVLCIGGVRRFGKRRGLKLGSGALRAAIAFTDASRHLTVFILNHERLISADHHLRGKSSRLTFALPELWSPPVLGHA